MSHSHGDQDDHGAHASTASAFSEADWEEFHRSDVQAGAAFVILIAAIFTIGLALYSGVLYFVMATPAMGS